MTPPPAPSRDTAAGRAYNDLRNLARRRNRQTSEYFTLYALEGFLARLAASEHAEDFVLKGGVLMAAFAQRRPTRDIDLAVSGFSNDTQSVEERVHAIVSIPKEDGLVFNHDSVRSQEIRDDADYAGVRVHVEARLATARIQLHADMNFGDPIWPAPTEAELPLLLGGTLRLCGYPDHMVLAEKIVTAVDRGQINTRWRDFVDIAAIMRTRRINYGDLRIAIETVAEHRDVTLEPLMPGLEGMPGLAQRKWAQWRRKQQLAESIPDSFSELLGDVSAFADPVLGTEAEGMAWDPESQSWQ